jgi:hypothetical protein
MYWKRWRIKRSRTWAGSRGVWAALWVMLLACGAAWGVDKVADLQKNFDKETHAGGKIKSLEKLAEAQFEATRKASASGDFNTVGFTFEKYRDNVRACFDLLRKQEPDADKHSGDYRRLELQTRLGIREVEDTLVIAPPEVHPPLEIVHKDILDMDDELIRLLFPKRTPEPVKVPPAPEAKP